MDRIPILKVGDFLLVSIQVDMHDRLAMSLQDDLTTQVVKAKAKGVLIDISSLEVVDSFIGRMLVSISGIAAVLGGLAGWMSAWESKRHARIALALHKNLCPSCTTYMAEMEYPL